MYHINKKKEERNDGRMRRSLEQCCNAVGMWLNETRCKYNFDSHDTSFEIWHMEYRQR